MKVVFCTPTYTRPHPAYVKALEESIPETYEIAGAEFGTVSFPRLSLMDIHILDGQHRILGMHLASKGITEDLDKARSALASARRVDPKSKAVTHAQERIDALNAQRKRLAEERVTVQIIVEENAVNYKQMFFDIADNALGITSSVKARFDNADQALWPGAYVDVIFTARTSASPGSPAGSGR